MRLPCFFFFARKLDYPIYELHVQTSSFFDLRNHMPYGKGALSRQRAQHSFLQVLSVTFGSDVVGHAQSMLCAHFERKLALKQCPPFTSNINRKINVSTNFGKTPQ